MTYLHNVTLRTMRLIGLLLIALVSFTQSVGPIAYAQEVDSTPSDVLSEPAADTPSATDEPSTEPAQDETSPDDADTGSTREPESNETVVDEVTADAHEATVVSGDAEAGGSVGQDVNNNDTTLEGGASSTIENINTATSTTEAGITAATGDNTASGTSATIATGDAIASANVVNVINSNIVNSTGLLYFLNLLFGQNGADLRSLFTMFADEEGVASSDAPCTLEVCEADDTSLTIANNNTATVHNDLVVRADSGGNTAFAGEGSASVTTGTAYASANVFNLVNTNIVDSNYLLVAINNFGDLLGDIVFPGADFFSSFLGSLPFSPSSETSVSNNNTATIENTLDVGADTGNNTATADGGQAVITTGDASAAATVINQANTNVVGDNLYVLFRIHGTWSGDIFGLPDGVTWNETADGIELLFGGSGASAGASTPSTLSIANTNDASIRNNVSVYALTGDNRAEGGDAASITTGDAMASTNIVNVANTNVVGSNWMLAIFNIFGDFEGDISFGKPDLWVGARAEVPSDLAGGSCFDYELTITNFGDARATSVVLNSTFDKALQVFDNPDKDTADGVEFSIGSLAPGSSREVSLPICLTDIAGEGMTVTTEFEVSAREPESNYENNTELISVVTRRSETSASGGGGILRYGDANLTITKEASTESVHAGESVDYTIRVRNTGGPVFNALLVDTLYDENNEPITEHRWGLETIKADEEIEVSYTVDFGTSTVPGTYRNEAFISGTEGNANYKKNYGRPVDSPVASASIEVLPLSDVPSEGVCRQLLTEYIRYGESNTKTEVTKLQYFLQTVENMEGIRLTGEYDETTYNAVRTLQLKYQDDVLTPWGIAEPTGYVYYTTQKKINELYCADLAFPLSDAQRAEIENFKIRVEELERTQRDSTSRDRGAAGVIPEEEPVLDLSTVGVAEPNPELGRELASVVAPEEATDAASGSEQLAAAANAAQGMVSGIMQNVRNALSSVFSKIGF